MKCPKCKRGQMRKQVKVIVDAPADCYKLSKAGIRSKDVNIMGVIWDEGPFYCDAGCGNAYRVGSGRGGSIYRADGGKLKRTKEK